MSLLGIDVGTSGCKSAVFSLDGRLLSLAYEEYDFEHPQPGWAELDSGRVWELIQRTIRGAASNSAGFHDPIQALCVSSLGEAAVPLTGNGRIIGPSILNFDTRGDEYLPALRQSMEVERFYEINGNIPGSQFSLTKLKWLKEHQPEVYNRAERFLLWSGFVSYSLGAEPHVDYSLANRTLLFDLEQGDWSPVLLSWAGLEREKLPTCLPSGQVVGHVRGGAAAELGLPAGIPIVSGGHDQCCNALGCGVIEARRAMFGMGSYLCAVPALSHRPEARRMIERGLSTEHHVVPGQYVTFIYNQGGMLVKWHRDTFAQAERQQALESGQDIYPALFAEMPEAPSRVMALPHFTITGTPSFIQDSSGVIAGLKLDTSRGEILKGIVESTTFYLRECFDELPGAGIEIEEFCAVGGGSKSDRWIQVCADILGKPIVRPKVSEAGVLGAAILAGVGSGIFDSVQSGVEMMVHLERRFDPDGGMQRLYDERYAKYRMLYPLMKEYLRELI